jgi:hypothetical protein
MSQENVERFIEVTEAFNRFAEEFDRDALESLIGFYDPDVNFEPRQATLQGGYSGHRGIRQWLADVVEHYGGGGHLDYVDIQDLGTACWGSERCASVEGTAVSRPRRRWRSLRPSRTG